MIVKNIKTLRGNVNNILDRLEKDLTDKAKTLLRKHESLMFEDKIKLLEVKSSLKRCSALLQKTSLLESFSMLNIIIPRIQEQVTRYQAFVGDISDAFEIIRLELQPEETLMQFLSFENCGICQLVNLKKRKEAVRQGRFEDRRLLRDYGQSKEAEITIPIKELHVDLDDHIRNHLT